MEEIWKDIVGYEGKYQISNMGNILSLNFNKTKKPKLMKLDTSRGYRQIRLNGKDAFYVHRLVGQAFLPNADNKPEINHINGVKIDNRVENLEWSTKSENCIHKYKILGYKNNRYGRFGSNNLAAKSVKQIDKISNNVIKIWGSIIDAAKELNGCSSSITKCCKGKLKIKVIFGVTIFEVHFHLELHQFRSFRS